MTSVRGHLGFLDSRLIFFWLDDVANATMCHPVAFKWANDAKKNDVNVYFHMEPGENVVGFTSF